jgi:secreted trypsin-like serine protease
VGILSLDFREFNKILYITKSLFFGLFISLFLLGCGSKAPTSSIVSGDQSQAIMGGSEEAPVALGKFKDNIYFLAEKRVDGITRICTAVRISQNFLATAAHCVESFADHPEKLLVLSNSEVWKTDSNPQNPISQNINVQNIILHPNSNAKDFWMRTDFALLQVEGMPSDYEATSTLIDFNMENENIFWAAGYGRTVDRGAKDTSTRRLRFSNLEFLGFSDKESDKLFFDQSSGVGTCFGDSGGPVYMTDNIGNIFLVGFTVASFNTSDLQKPCHGISIALNLSSVSNWINEKISNESK